VSKDLNFKVLRCWRGPQTKSRQQTLGLPVSQSVSQLVGLSVFEYTANKTVIIAHLAMLSETIFRKCALFQANVIAMIKKNG